VPVLEASLTRETFSVLAYVGPGAGLELVGYALTLLVFVGTALLSVLLWPIRMLRQRLRGSRTTSVPAPPATAPPAVEPAPVETHVENKLAP
jgi:hypothetical protein